MSGRELCLAGLDDHHLSDQLRPVHPPYGDEHYLGGRFLRQLRVKQGALEEAAGAAAAAVAQRKRVLRLAAAEVQDAVFARAVVAFEISREMNPLVVRRLGGVGGSAPDVHGYRVFFGR